MLRTYKPLEAHEIFIHQLHVRHLVCDVLCNASDDNRYLDLLSEEFKDKYLSREGKTKDLIRDTYEICKSLRQDERQKIREAFNINNDIESLCEGQRPIELGDMPSVVEQMMKPLLLRFYNVLISPKEKLKYYNDLISNNENFHFCPCCGINRIEGSESAFREDNDHYLPKSQFPFASVNFKNIPPICIKCNRNHKRSKNPFEKGQKAFYPFKPLESEFEINIDIDESETPNYKELKEDDIEIRFNNDAKKVETWDSLFEIKKRYNEEIRQFSKGELRALSNRYRKDKDKNENISYIQLLNEWIEDYEIDKYDDRKFLKASFLRSISQKPELLEYYEDKSLV